MSVYATVTYPTPHRNWAEARDDDLLGIARRRRRCCISQTSRGVQRDICGKSAPRRLARTFGLRIDAMSIINASTSRTRSRPRCPAREGLDAVLQYAGHLEGRRGRHWPGRSWPNPEITTLDAYKGFALGTYRAHSQRFTRRSRNAVRRPEHGEGAMAIPRASAL